MRRIHRWLVGMLFAVGMVVGALTVPHSRAYGPAAQQTPGPEVYAEAIGQANLRQGPGLEYPVAGEITSGTRYRVLARHAVYPWLRLEYPAVPEAWVYRDLVTVSGDLSLVPVVDDIPPTATEAPPVPADDPLLAPPSPTPASTSPTATSTPAGPIVTTLGKANVRYGPGTEYPTIVEAAEGESYRLLEMHALVPWVRIDLPESATGSGWIYREIIEITGDTSQVPVTNVTHYSVPELTPTPQTVVINGAPWQNAPAAPGSLANTLGEEMHRYLLAQGFIPYTDRFASVFVLDLQTGDTFTLHDGVAYSGMSLTKIPILVTYFQRHDGPLSEEEAFLITDTMMCSENITTNRLLEIIGDGDPLRGAQRVTALLQSLDLRGTFLMRQYTILENEPVIEVGTIRTGADQVSARPDLYNQLLPRDMGWLLAGIYQCAVNESGLLMERYPNEFNAQECRQMLAALDANEIGVFLEAGVPDDARVYHKHGWIADTHGDAGIVIGPDSAYVFVAALYGEEWLAFEEYSAPVLGELSRMTWNTFNPDATVEAITPRIVPAECDPRADPVMALLLSGSTLPAPGPQRQDR